MTADDAVAGLPPGGSEELFLSWCVSRGQPHPFDVLHIRLDGRLSDAQLVDHVHKRLELLVPQAIAQLRRGGQS